MQESMEDVFRFTTFCVQFICYISLFVMNLFPEPRATRRAYSILTDDITEVSTDVVVYYM